MAEWERVVDGGLNERVRVSSRTSQTKIFLRREQGGAGARLEAARYLSIQLDVQTQVQMQTQMPISMQLIGAGAGAGEDPDCKEGKNFPSTSPIIRQVRLGRS